MGDANAFRFRAACTTCYRRSSFLNTDSMCAKCSIDASKAKRSVVSTVPVDAGLVPRHGWDIGVCIRCGFIKTCQDSVCRECREHGHRPHDLSPRLHAQDDDLTVSWAELDLWRQAPRMMTDTPEWTQEPPGWAYTLINSGIRGRVWHRMGKWEAIVSEHGGYLSAGDFRTAEEAKAWCEERIAERRAGT